MPSDTLGRSAYLHQPICAEKLLLQALPYLQSYMWEDDCLEGWQSSQLERLILSIETFLDVPRKDKTSSCLGQ